MTICICSTIPLNSANGAATFNNYFLLLFSQYGYQLIYLFVDVNATVGDEDVTEHHNNYIAITLRKSYRQHLKKYKGYFRSGGSNAPKWIAAGFTMREWLLQNATQFNIDVIETSDGSGLGAFLMDNQLPTVILTAHGSNLQISRFDFTATDEHGKVIKKLEYLAYENAEAIISHSMLNTGDLKSFTNNPIYTLPIPWLSALTPKVAIDENASGLVVGALRYLKGPDLLCKALQILQNDKADIKVQWIGEDTDSISGYRSVSAYLQKRYSAVFQKSLIWNDALTQAEVMQEIRKAAYVIIPSVWETFSYVALEAAALGKPIIITKTTGAAYLFTNNTDAIIIEENNDQQLSKAILKLHMDKALRDYLGKNAQQTIAEKLKPDDIVTKRIKVYQKVIQERKVFTNSVEERLSFLKKYFTKRRRMYFFIRAKLKDLYQA